MERKGNRIRTMVVTDDLSSGGTEFYWARANDDHSPEYEGSLALHEDGSVGFKCWTNDEIPLVLTIHANRIIVTVGEDMIPGTELELDLENAEVAFDSEQHDYGQED